MSNQLEELFLTDEEELEEVKKYLSFYMDIPVVSVGHRIYFNVAAAPYIPEHIKWYTTSSLIVGLPASEHDHSAFTVNTHNSGMSSSIPAAMREKKLQKGIYQLYKYKNGFAIKRYEPLELRAS